MKLGKKQATYGAVLGLAAVAFVIDRLCFSPENAGAATAPAAVEKSAPEPGACGDIGCRELFCRVNSCRLACRAAARGEAGFRSDLSRCLCIAGMLAASAEGGGGPGRDDPCTQATVARRDLPPRASSGGRHDRSRDGQGGC